MSSTPLVSVIIPVYNRKEKVVDAVRSVMYQNFTNWELIIVDDGSDDGTLEVLGQFDRIDKIHIHTITHSGCPGFVRNRGAEHSTGTWLAFLDSDDLWSKDKLEKQILSIGNTRGIRFVHTGEIWMRNGKEVSQAHRKHRREGDLFEVSLGKCEIGPSTVMMTRDLFFETGGFREDLEICEDYEYWLRICDRNSVAYVDVPLVTKQAGHGDQLSFKYGQIEIFKIAALKDLVDSRAFTAEHMALSQKVLAEKCRIYSGGCKKRGRISEADEFEKLYLYYNRDDVQNNG